MTSRRYAMSGCHVMSWCHMTPGCRASLRRCDVGGCREVEWHHNATWRRGRSMCTASSRRIPCISMFIGYDEGMVKEWCIKNYNSIYICGSGVFQGCTIDCASVFAGCRGLEANAKCLNADAWINLGLGVWSDKCTVVSSSFSHCQPCAYFTSGNFSAQPCFPHAQHFPKIYWFSSFRRRSASF